jgi:hypothetical protein
MHLKHLVDAAKGTAQGLVDALPSTEQTAKDALDARLDALTTTVPAVNDTDSNGVIRQYRRCSSDSGSRSG